MERSRRPKPAPHPWPAQLKLSRARQAEFVICDYAIERTFAWFARFRRLVVRYERRGDIFEAFHHLATAMICFKFIERWFCWALLYPENSHFTLPIRQNFDMLR